jgi:hypothetical protein
MVLFLKAVGITRSFFIMLFLIPHPLAAGSFIEFISLRGALE